MEADYKETVFFRAGYHYGDGEKALPSFASVGAGLSFFGISMDFSYLLASRNLSGTMLFGLGYRF